MFFGNKDEGLSSAAFPSTAEAVVVVFVAVVFLHLIVVNWSGDEVARLEVRPSDTVIVGMRQIEEQLGVSVARQMLVCGEDELEAGQAWSTYGSVRDWSTVQLTTLTAQMDAETDREALMKLFESCGGSGWTRNTNWGSAEPLSSWEGVEEVDACGRVTQLGLNFNKLTGAIPPEIGNLTALTEICLHHNQLTGVIPPEIGNLTALTKLFLSFNQLTGGIPPEIGNLTALTCLFLGGNELTGGIPPEIGRRITDHSLLYFDM